MPLVNAGYLLRRLHANLPVDDHLQDVARFKLGRTNDYIKRKGQWARQCPSTVHSLIDTTPTKRAVRLEKILLLLFGVLSESATYSIQGFPHVKPRDPNGAAGLTVPKEACIDCKPS